MLDLSSSSIMLLLALAIAPGLAVCIYIFYRDVHDKEPALSLVVSFLTGILATVPAAFLENNFRGLTDNSIAGIVFSSFVFIALIEEGSKFLADVPDFNSHGQPPRMISTP